VAAFAISEPQSIENHKLISHAHTLPARGTGALLVTGAQCERCGTKAPEIVW
jgi:hypothetical protein